MPRPPVKKTERLAAAQVRGAEKARLKILREMKWGDRLLLWVDEMVKKVNPLELAALVGGTILIHELISQADELFQAASKLQVTKETYVDISKFPLIADAIGVGTAPSERVTNIQTETTIWLISLFACYLILKAAPHLLSSGGLGLTSFLKTFLGVAAVP